MRIIELTMVLLSSSLLAAGSALAADPPRPPAPPATVPDIVRTNPPVLCVGCDEPFDTTTHKEVLARLVNNPYNTELRKALYLQDIVHQFESKAHFDNCDFDSSIAYITSLLDEAETHVAAASKAKAAGNQEEVKMAAGRAFFAIGQALHGVQDFYAHTNYVELEAPKVKKVTDLELIAPWRANGRDRIKELQGRGLVSGFVFWGFPQNCPRGTASHSDLAKDSAATKSGARHVAHLQNLSQYRIAVYLAREASLQLMTDAFKRWPLLRELNGQNVAVEILLDRRGIEQKK